MPSTPEQCIVALHTSLKTELPNLKRNQVSPEKIVDDFMVLRDGERTLIDPDLNGIGGYYRQTVELEIVVQHQDDSSRDVMLDLLMQKVQVALHNNKALGGLVDVLQALPPETNTDQDGNSMAVKTASIPIEMEFYAETALGAATTTEVTS